MGITEQLKAPFDPKVISWRVGEVSKKKDKAIALAYLNARDVMKRLDDVCGDHWQVEYPFDGCCRIGIKIDNEWIWRSNGAGETNIEGEKGKFSDAFKRAAVLWGVGRYLYYLPNEWVEIDEYKKLKRTPKLPAWAMPKAPELREHTREQKAKFDNIITNGEDLDMFVFSKSIPRAEFSSLYNSFPDGQVTKYKKIVDGMGQNGKELHDKYLSQMQEATHNNDEIAFKELSDELSPMALTYIKDQL